MDTQSRANSLLLDAEQWRCPMTRTAIPLLRQGFVSNRVRPIRALVFDYSALTNSLSNSGLASSSF